MLDGSSLTESVVMTYNSDGSSGTIASADSTRTAQFSGVEQVRLSGANHNVDASATTTGIRIELDEGDHTVTGGSGNDVITGEGTITGGLGNDIITGWGNLQGGEGDDTIYSSAGAYEGGSSTGGAGADVFHTDVVLGIGDLSSYQAATITDYTPGTDGLSMNVLHRTADPVPTVTITNDAATSTSTVVVNGQPMLIIQGAGALTESDIALTVNTY